MQFENQTIWIQEIREIRLYWSYLDVVVWIPVRVVDDDSVGGVQVDAETPGFRRKQERKLKFENKRSSVK